MTDEPQTSDQIAELLVHLGRAARSEDTGSFLTAAQWTCLRFFARANGSTRTPSAFASFQATTRGTASQIVKSLERQGLVSRSRSDRDRRSVCFDVTEHGQQMLMQDPLRDVIAVIDSLGAAEGARLLRTLSRLTSALSARRDLPCFGTCQDCSHFGSTQDSAYCACMAADLAETDISKLCASYAPMPDLHDKETRNAAS
ncbi:MarR family winged helix-turn-helix transcriptional regulator [Marivita sp. S0852]|uniref:MarR family winged helix-turn-helix transcriptional regulator n=1 Tax=Marivita sp. S0852 TaxID=3373893 RepID=UPI003982885F